MSEKYWERVINKMDTFFVSATVTRPANTTAYTAGDVISNATASASASVNTFTAIAGADAGKIRIEEVMVTTDNLGSPTPVLELWLYNAVGSAKTDNAAFTISDAENSTVVAVIPLVQSFSATNNARLEASALGRVIKLASNSKTLWWDLKVMNAYTPASGEVFGVTVKGFFIDEGSS